MIKAILILAALFATWMVWPEISGRFVQRWDDLPTLDIKRPTPEVTDPDIIYHGAKQWDPFTAPTGYEQAPTKKAPQAVKGTTQGDEGCNRILPNSGRCDALQYHSGALHVPSSGTAVNGLL